MVYRIYGHFTIFLYSQVSNYGNIDKTVETMGGETTPGPTRVLFTAL